MVISGMQSENDKYDIGVFGFKSHKLQPTNAITICCCLRWFLIVSFSYIRGRNTLFPQLKLFELLTSPIAELPSPSFNL